jgi:tetrahydromethanopterin S-methyltransferase subunit B
MQIFRTLFLCGLLWLSVASAGAQEETVNELDPALQAQMAELEAWTESTRGLSASTPIERIFPSREDVRAYIEEQYRTQLEPELARRSLAFYQALGLVAPGTDLVQIFIDVLGDQVAGFYDPDTGEMNVVPLAADAITEELSFLEEIVYVHEYTHALQDQNYDLDLFVGNEALSDHPDRALAAISLVEGDATAVMTYYAQEVAMSDPGAAMALLEEGADIGGLTPPENIPDALMNELLFPYQAGMFFVFALLDEGGWESAGAAFDNPPTTSEQIMHPDKYLAGETALPIRLEATDGLLEGGWELAWDTTLGEFYLLQHLLMGVNSDDAEEAAEGWGGDHLRIYVNAAGDVAWVLKLAWDTPQDAAEFADAYADYAEAFIGSDGELLFGDQMECYTAATALCIEINYEIIAGAPTMEVAAALIDAQFD